MAVVSEDDRVHLKPITVSRLLDNVIEVAEGISASDRIVNNPSAALLEGDKVRIVTPATGYDLVRQRNLHQKQLHQRKDHRRPYDIPADRYKCARTNDIGNALPLAPLRMARAAGCCWRSPCRRV